MDSCSWILCPQEIIERALRVLGGLENEEEVAQDRGLAEIGLDLEEKEGDGGGLKSGVTVLSCDGLDKSVQKQVQESIKGFDEGGVVK